MFMKFGRLYPPPQASGSGKIVFCPSELLASGGRGWGVRDKSSLGSFGIFYLPYYLFVYAVRNIILSSGDKTPEDLGLHSLHTWLDDIGKHFCLSYILL